MALLILAKKVLKPIDIVGSIKTLSIRNNFKCEIEDKGNNLDDEDIELYISKLYEDEENEQYFYLGLESDPMEIEERGLKYYRLGITDQADYDHLMYDFSLDYLRLNPNHCISFHGDSFFFLSDMEKIEAKGGYYKEWCY